MKLHPNIYIRISIVSLCTLAVCSIALAITISLLTRAHIHNDVAGLSSAQAVLILGAGVYSNKTLTPILQDRVDTAISVYKQGLATKILVSGDNSKLSYNEVVPVHEYLVSAGIPASDIFLDYAGFDTYDSMYRARTIFQVESVIVVTQAFHLPRAVYIAQALGIKAQGIETQGTDGTSMNYLREVPADIKAFIDIAFKSKPTYEGEIIPITGDGRATLGE